MKMEHSLIDGGVNLCFNKSVLRFRLRFFNGRLGQNRKISEYTRAAI